ncbi:KH domain-containing protein [Candidatus Gracilibacteria bacterium]|nr:KH domain-containing protein [Candidatus Gracilibacteria bacterium]
MTAMQYLEFIISAIVVNTSAIEITEKQDELGTLLSLRVDPSDMGSLIGRGGKTIDAVRTVMRVYGSKAGIRLNLRIIEEPRTAEIIA